MGHFLFAVLFGNVFQHFIPAVIIEIHIDIGEGDTVRIQESFEKEVVFYRVYLSDAKTIGRG